MLIVPGKMSLTAQLSSYTLIYKLKELRGPLMLLKLPFFICGLYRLIHGEINAGKMAATERAVRSYSTKQIYGVNSNYKKKKKKSLPST